VVDLIGGSGLDTVLVAFDAPRQVVFTGAVTGFTYGVLAIGLILVYRSSGVINFAYTEMGAFGAGLLAVLVANYDWNYYVGLATVLVVGGLIGAAVELSVVRRLFEAPRVILFVATLGVAQLLLVAQLHLPRLDSFGPYPSGFDKTWRVGGLIIRSEHVLVLVLVPLLTAALAYFLGYTRYGVAIRAAASNADAARLNAIRVRRMSTIVWVIAGVLATVTVVLIVPLRGGSAADTINLGPSLLMRALAAGLIGRMRNMPLALLGGIAIGVTEALFFFNNSRNPGQIDALLFIVVLVTVLSINRGTRTDTEGRWSFSPRVRAIPANLADLWWVKRLPQMGALFAVVAGVALPLVVTQASRQFLYGRMLIFAAVAVSLVILTGWAGQLSLGQFALVGVGAMTTTALVSQVGMAYELAVPAAGAVTVLVAVAVGAPALQVRGLFLAVTTLAFAVMAENWLLSRDLFTDGAAILRLPRARWGDGFSLESQRTFYYVSLVFLIVVAVLALRIRRSGVGRSMIAVRENEAGAAAFTISPTRTKLTAFAIGGAIAGVAGGLLAGLLVQFDSTAFDVEQSLRVVSIVVIGGLASVAGAVLGALWVIGLPALIGDSQEIRLLTSGIGLLVLLMYFPGGLIQVFYNIRDSIFSIVSARRPEVVIAKGDTTAIPTGLQEAAPEFEDPADDAEPAPALATRSLSVRFGERVVVNDIDIEVGRGEIVGLIGTNGAGKSTFMNAVGGFVSSTGEVEILGHPADGIRANRRAALGLGRAFQNADLFGDLTVRETVMTALEARERSTLTATLLALPKAGRAERRKRAEADELIGFFGLGRYADAFVDELSTGTRRIVELACLVGLDAKVLCLDEPTAGVAQRETEAFGPLIVQLRKELGASMLVIEHDMPLIMSISDRVYCLEAGQLIAEGDPDAVRNDPAVIASYLGTDERAIQRRDSVK
jgi:ABC-type branched-subunit amino acid transport system ATPase component/ABC-type branched-subunit amino acid transport system permease subunit